MVGFTYSGSGLSSGIKFYDNGQEIVLTDNLDCAAAGYVAMRNQTDPIRIGRYSDNTFPWADDMGHVMIASSTALTADQMLKLYNSSKMFYGL